MLVRVEAFIVPLSFCAGCQTVPRHSGKVKLFQGMDEGDGNGGTWDDFDGGDGNEDAPSIFLEDLAWRVEKVRLEEANKKRFLKSGPRFLPYEECRKWVQAWNRWETEQDWKDWIAEGEKRNSYIPARPDEYYSRMGQWISWDHFLGVAERSDERKGSEVTSDKPENNEFQ